MFEEFISQIKEKQDLKDKEVSELLPAINKFHQHLIDNLISFITLAKEKGIRGVELQDPKVYPNGVSEFIFTLAEIDCILVTNNNVEKLTLKNNSIGNHAFIYHDRSEDSLPEFQISIIKNSDGRRFYSVSGFANGETRHITGHTILGDDSGEEAAKRIIKLIYDYEAVLRDRPTFKAFYIETSKYRKLGFPL